MIRGEDVPVRYEAWADPVPPGPGPRGQAYSSRANRAYLRRRKIEATIPIKIGQQAHRLARGSAGGRPPVFDPDVYRRRHAVECAINLLNTAEQIATRYDELALRYEASLHVATINIWLRVLAASI